MITRLNIRLNKAEVHSNRNFVIKTANVIIKIIKEVVVHTFSVD